MIENNLISMLVEGGQKVFTSFLKYGDVDRLIVITAPKLFGNGICSFRDLYVDHPENALCFKEHKWHRIDEDMVFEGWF
jgi:riboflavin biosynthesis pyrimidine reductase